MTAHGVDTDQVIPSRLSRVAYDVILASTSQWVDDGPRQVCKLQTLVRHIRLSRNLKGNAIVLHELASACSLKISLLYVVLVLY